MKNLIRQKLISVVLSVADVILFYVTENAHIRIHHHSAGFDHGLPRSRSTGKLKNLCILCNMKNCTNNLQSFNCVNKRKNNISRSN